MAERMGARIMGLGAFTKVVGDAGITVAHEADIAVTSGNSLTVAATLEAAKIAVSRWARSDLTQGKVMIIGATGSIGSVCSRLLAAGHPRRRAGVDRAREADRAQAHASRRRRRARKWPSPPARMS